jgi:hypothetical protein
MGAATHHAHPRFEWSVERLDTLTQMLAAKKTASEIAQLFGVTRNVIIGAVYRRPDLPGFHRGSATRKGVALPKTISLPGATSQARHVSKRRNDENQSIMAKVLVRKRIEAGDVAPPTQVVGAAKFAPGFMGQQARVKRLDKLERHHCRFPIDLPGGQVGYCGDVKEETSSYCPHHAARCFNPDSAAMRRRLS